MTLLENLKPDVREYLSTSLADFYARLDHRFLVYAVVFVFSGLCTFGALWSYMALFNIIYYGSPQSFSGMYSWHTGANFTLCLVVVDMLYALAPRSWGAFRRRTVGKTWLVFLSTFAVGFATQRIVIYRLIDDYSPRLILFYERYPAELPGALPMMAYMLPFWLAIGYAVIRLILGMQARSEELLRVRVDTILEERANTVGCDVPPRQDPTASDDDALQLPADQGTGPIRRSQIGHITVEDHYLRIYYHIEGKRKDTLIRMSLKELADRLPPEQFIQIHRSHIVNLEWISGVKRTGRDVRLTVKHGDFHLPVSRYRLPQLLPVMDSFLDRAPN